MPKTRHSGFLVFTCYLFYIVPLRRKSEEQQLLQRCFNKKLSGIIFTHSDRLITVTKNRYRFTHNSKQLNSFLLKNGRNVYSALQISA